MLTQTSNCVAKLTSIRNILLKNPHGVRAFHHMPEGLQGEHVIIAAPQVRLQRLQVNSQAANNFRIVFRTTLSLAVPSRIFDDTLNHERLNLSTRPVQGEAGAVTATALEQAQWTIRNCKHVRRAYHALARS